MLRSISILMFAGLVTACASSTAPRQAEATPEPAAKPAATPAAPARAGKTRIVKSIDGTYDGEIVGTVPPNSRFAKLRIGMTMAEVNALIKAPDDLKRHETGKRWIPFYFGNDAQRLQVYYEGEGCLTYTGGNVFGGGGNQLIRIYPSATKACYN